MISIQHIRPAEYTYELPSDRIALFPAAKRDQSRLLIHNERGKISEDIFKNLATYLPDRSWLFYNNSRVIPARLNFPSPGGSVIEIFCLRPLDPADYQNSLASLSSCIWECMIGNVRRFKEPVLKIELNIRNKQIELLAERVKQNGNTAHIVFRWNEADISFAEIISVAGRTPLPPYIKREVLPMDRERYQTVYSRIEGSVAAPTAGLHFTDEVVLTLIKKNIRMQEITLHVGAGTFQPVKSEYVSEHAMHAEQFEISYDLLKKLSEVNERVTCVGTTTVRTLESLYWIGAKLLQNDQLPESLKLEQWEPYSIRETDGAEAFNAILNWFKKKKVDRTMASTAFMIVPGYRFKMTERLITNFHQPGSSLLMLIAAFIGEKWKQTYQYALDNGFRFLSYGDSSLLFRSDFSVEQ